MVNDDNEGHGHFAVKAKLCGHFDERCKNIIDQLFSRKFAVEKGGLFVQENENVAKTFLLNSGWAAHELFLPNGSRQITSLFLPGNLFPVRTAMSQSSQNGRVVALSECTVTYCASSDLSEAAGDHGNLARTLWWLSKRDVSILRAWVAVNSQYKAPIRLAHLFSEIVHRLQTSGANPSMPMYFPLTQNDLSAVVGVSVVHINRILQRMRREGLIGLNRKQLQVYDRCALEAAGKFDPNYLYPT